MVSENEKCGVKQAAVMHPFRLSLASASAASDFVIVYIKLMRKRFTQLGELVHAIVRLQLKYSPR